MRSSYPAFNVEKWVKPNDRVVEAAPPRRRWLPGEAHEKTIDAEVARLKAELTPRAEGSPKREGGEAEGARQGRQGRRSAKRQPHPGRIAWVADLRAEPVDGAALAPRQPEHARARRSARASPRSWPIPTIPSTSEAAVAGGAVDGPAAGPGAVADQARLAPAALLARVLANRIWQDHFGVGLVATSDNLGYTGSPPTHPELLEYLAAELVRSGWSAKALHRLILALRGLAAVERDLGPRPRRSIPRTACSARFPLRRLDAEADPRRHARGLGRARRPPGRAVGADPADRDAARSSPTDPDGASLRRSVYLQQRRTQIASLLEVFDAPSIVTTCTRRLPGDDPAAIAQPAELRVRRRPRRQAGRAARTRMRRGRRARGPHRPRLPVCRRPRARRPRSARRPCGSCRPSPPAIPSSRRAEARRRAWADFCQMLLASNAFLYVE